MQYLLDTQVIVWLEESPEKIPAHIQDKITSTERIFISKVSIWEIVIKKSLGKLRLEKDTGSFIHALLHDYGFTLIDIEIPDLIKLEELPLHHRDPFDRLLISQSMARDIPIISADSIFKLYPSKTYW